MVGVDTTYTMLQKWDKTNIYIKYTKGIMLQVQTGKNKET